MSETATPSPADVAAKAQTPEPAPEATPEVAPTDAPSPGEDALGDAGKKALDAMKAERKAANDRAKAAEAELDRLKAASEGREAEWKAKQEADAAVDKRYTERVVKAEIRAAAAGKLSDPADALKFLDLSEFEVNADGDVDAEAMSAAIDRLVTTKPYLAVQDGPRFKGSLDAGPRNAEQTRITEAQLDQMSPAEVNKARREGRLTHLL